MAKFDDKISNLIKHQGPDFVLDDHPYFLEFVKAYYTTEDIIQKPKPKMTKEMGYISNVKDACKSLENIFKNS